MREYRFEVPEFVKGLCRLFAVFVLPVLVGIWLLSFPLGYSLPGFGDDEPPPRPASSPTTTTPISWTFLGNSCADGSSSSAIGRRGACSYHGGVVSVWSKPDGYTVRCRGGGGTLPRTEEAFAQLVAQFGSIGC